MPGVPQRLALIVIDMMNEFFERQPALAAQRSRLVDQINELVEACRSTGAPVIWVRAEFASDLSDASLEMRRDNIRVAIAGTSGCDLLADLRRTPNDVVVIKKRYSAFFKTELDAVLSTLQVARLIVAGVNTHACVRTTVIDAYQRDLDVIVADECVASYDAGHDAITRRYLDGKIARFMSNEAIVALLRDRPSHLPTSTAG